MSDEAVGFLRENLTQLLLYNAELIGDTRSQIEGLLQDLIIFKAALREFSESSSNNHTLLAVANNIRSVVQKCDDVMDKYVLQMARFNAKNASGKAMGAVGHSVTIRNLVKEIKSIRTEVEEIYREKQFFFQAVQNLRNGDAIKKEPPEVEEDIVVGFDEEAKTVIERLIAKVQDLDIITITGMAGLGKTTLARKIYNDSTIEFEFFTRVWVFVSPNYSRREIFLSILNSFPQTTDYDYANKSDDFIAKDLRKHFEKGKYLIIMDDVWTIEAWNDLKIAFPDNKNGSRVLITSQNIVVAHHANRTKDPHFLKFLTPEESWELLEKKVFGNEKCPPGELQELGVHIATECKGLPLAVEMIADILSSDCEGSHWWEQVAQNVGAFIVTYQNQFRDVIALSYNDLRYGLQSCFLYLGVFPKDYEIPVWNLICLWIAEGFIEQKGGLSLEDIAENCVEALVNKNLLMVVQRRSDGRIKTCRVNSMIREFCKMEARKQKFFREIKGEDQVSFDKYRRVCVHSNFMEYISLKPSTEHVHSLLSFASDEITFPQEHISTIFIAFEVLRVLDIRSIIFKTFPERLFELALLKHLALSCDTEVLPSSISKLWYLKTLIFFTASRTLELTKGMWNMSHLRHLRTNSSALLPPPPSSTPDIMENVQSLSLISPKSCTESVLARTPNILKLGVRGNLLVLVDNLFDNVGRLEYLTNLKLINDIDGGSTSEGKILDLPPPYKFPTKLKKLTLSNTLLDWDQMQILGNLEKLEVLKLKDNAFRGQLWEPEDGGFLGLKFLHIGRTDLVTWKASKHHFPSLKRLVLQHCGKLEVVPIGLADVASFQELELYRTPKAASSAREIQQRKMITGGGFKLYIYPSDI